MSKDRAELQRSLIVLLAAARKACICSQKILDADRERGELMASRAAAGRAVLRYCERTDSSIEVFERALVDGDLENEALFSALLDITDAIREFLHRNREPEILRVQAGALVRNSIRLTREWCKFRGLKAAAVDSRLDSTDFANR
jgi:hypothetical protein